MQEQIIKLALYVGVPALLGAVINVMSKSRAKTVKMGINHGIVLSSLIRGLLIKLGGKVPAVNKVLAKLENGIEYSIIDYCKGLLIGVRADNKEDSEKIKAAIAKLNDENIKIMEDDIMGNVRELSNGNK